MAYLSLAQAFKGDDTAESSATGKRRSRSSAPLRSAGHLRALRFELRPFHAQSHFQDR